MNIGNFKDIGRSRVEQILFDIVAKFFVLAR
jgi:hypothetical protein